MSLSIRFLWGWLNPITIIIYHTRLYRIICDLRWLALPVFHVLTFDNQCYFYDWSSAPLKTQISTCLSVGFDSIRLGFFRPPAPATNPLILQPKTQCLSAKDANQKSHGPSTICTGCVLHNAGIELGTRTCISLRFAVGNFANLSSFVSSCDFGHTIALAHSFAMQIQHNATSICQHNIYIYMNIHHDWIIHERTKWTNKYVQLHPILSNLTRRNDSKCMCWHIIMHQT